MVKVKSSILDVHGRPFERELLTREIAAPTLGGVRSVLSGHPAQGLDPMRLARIMRDAEAGNTDAYFDLAEEIEEKYLHYQGVLSARKLAVAQLPITVAAATDDARGQGDADLVRKVLRRPAIRRARKDMLDALGKGYSIQEVVWATGQQWLPVRLVNRNQKWFELDQNDLETLRLRGGPDGTAGLATDLPPYKFLIHRHTAKTGLPIRGGLARGVAWAWLFQNFAIKDWVIFAEIYGIPMRLGKYDSSATEDDRRTLMRAVVGIGTDTAGIIPKSMEVEFVNGLVSGNAEVFHNLITMLDQQVSKAVLGQTGTTDATTGGFGSSGAVHNEVRQDIKRADAEGLAETLTEMAQWMVDFNHGPPPSGEYPEVNIGEDEFFSVEDMEKIERFVDLGGEVEESVVRDKLGLPDPADRKDTGKPVRLLRPRSAASRNPAPQTEDDGAGGSDIPAAALNAHRPFLNRLKGVLKPEGAVAASALSVGAAQSTAHGEDKDRLDDLVDAAANEWTEVMAPLIGDIEEMVAAANSYDEIIAGLSALADTDPAKLTGLLARTLFAARLEGETDGQG